MELRLSKGAYKAAQCIKASDSDPDLQQWMLQRLKQQGQADLAHKINDLVVVMQQRQPQLAAAAQHPMLPMPPQQAIPMLEPPYNAAAAADSSRQFYVAARRHAAEAVQPPMAEHTLSTYQAAAGIIITP